MNVYREMGDVDEKQARNQIAGKLFNLGILVSVATLSAYAGYQAHASQAGLQHAEPLNMLAKDPIGGPGAPRGKQVVVGMDTNVNMHVEWDNWDQWSKVMAPWWTEDFIYDFAYVGNWNFGPTKGLRAWFEGEHMHFNRAIPDSQWQDFIRAATDQTSTSATYGLAYWKGDWAGVPPPPGGLKLRIRDLDFYQLDGNRISINWCIVDVVDMFQQAGYNVLPEAPLPSLGYYAPYAMDGLTAPLSSMFTPEDAAASRKVWEAALAQDYDQQSLEAGFWAEDMVWYGPGGVGTAKSRQDYVKHWLSPLFAAFSETERKTDLVVCEGPYCGAHFYIWGTHTGEWFGEKATGKRVPIRCGAHAHIVGGKIVEGWLIIDVPRAFHAMGVDFYARAKAIAEEKAKPKAPFLH